MSGVKYTDYRIAREQQQRLDALQRIAATREAIESLRKQLRAAVSALNVGLRDTFQHQVSAAEGWLNTTIPEFSIAVSDRTANKELNRIEKAVKDAFAEGTLRRQQLIESITTGASEMERILSLALSEYESQYSTQHTLLKQWYGADYFAELEQGYSALRNLLQIQKYAKLSGILQASQAELISKIADAEAKEAKHQQRLYLIRSLRDVCVELGFDEIEAPHYENVNDRGSRFIYKVDTHTQGIIDFSITMETVTTTSDMHDEQCISEFTAVAQGLKEKFGIATAFKTEDGKPLPILRQRGALEEPDGTGRTAHA